MLYDFTYRVRINLLLAFVVLLSYIQLLPKLETTWHIVTILALNCWLCFKEIKNKKKKTLNSYQHIYHFWYSFFLWVDPGSQQVHFPSAWVTSLNTSCRPAVLLLIFILSLLPFFYFTFLLRNIFTGHKILVCMGLLLSTWKILLHLFLAFAIFPTSNLHPLFSLFCTQCVFSSQTIFTIFSLSPALSNVIMLCLAEVFSSCFLYLGLNGLPGPVG